MSVSLFTFFSLTMEYWKKRLQGYLEKIFVKRVFPKIYSRIIIVSVWIYPYGAIGNPEDLNDWGKTQLETNWLRSTQSKKSIQLNRLVQKKERNTWHSFPENEVLEQDSSSYFDTAAIKEWCWRRWSITRLSARRKATNLAEMHSFSSSIFFYFFFNDVYGI